MSNFGKNIRYLRKLNNMSQDKLAEKLGYKSFTTIQKWESGNSEPSLKKLNQLSEIFNVDIDKLATNDLSEDKDNEKIKPISPLSPEEKQILDPYSQLNPEGKEKAVSYTWDLVDSNKYNKDNQTTIPSRQEMISYLSDMEMAAIDGELNIHTMTDENLYSLYKMIKEDDKWTKEI